MAIIVIAIASLLTRDRLADGTPLLTGGEWSWFVFRVVLVYVSGNVGAKAVEKFLVR